MKIPFLGTLEWQSPLWFIAAYVVVAAVIFQLLARRRRREVALEFSGAEMLARFAPPVSRRRFIPALLVIAGTLVCVLGAAHPVLVKERARELVVVLDTSNSMNATDIAPSRGQAASEAAKQFINEIPADVSVGLVTFDRAVRKSIPTSTDRTRVIAELDGVTTGGGTAIGDSIMTATRFVNSDATLVVISDGGTTDGRPGIDAALEAARKGVRISTIAIGTPDGTVIDNGETVRVAVATQELAGVAAASGGGAYVARTPEQLTSAFSTVTSDLPRAADKDDLASLVGGIGVLIICAGIILGSRWTLRLP